MIVIKEPWNNSNYLQARLEKDLQEGKDLSPEEWGKPMKYYLCGPIDSAGKREENLQAFHNAYVDLTSHGLNVIMPVIIPGEDYKNAIRKDIRDLTYCDAIILLPGWPQSKGARGELSIAMYLNMKVYYYDGEYPDVDGRLMSMNFPDEIIVS